MNENRFTKLLNVFKAKPQTFQADGDTYEFVRQLNEPGTSKEGDVIVGWREEGNPYDQQEDHVVFKMPKDLRNAPLQRFAHDIPALTEVESRHVIRHYGMRHLVTMRHCLLRQSSTPPVKRFMLTCTIPSQKGNHLTSYQITPRTYLSGKNHLCAQSYKLFRFL